MIARSRISFATLLISITSMSASVLGNLIVNGSCELPSVAVGTYVNYPAGSADIPGWVVVGVDSAIVNEAFYQNGIHFEASNGHQWIDLAGVTSNSHSSGVVQFVPTKVGMLYEIRFSVGSATDNRIFFPATIDVQIDDGDRAGYANHEAPTDSLNWQHFRSTFIAMKDSTKLAFLNGSAPNNFNSALDDVIVQLVGGCDLNQDGGLDAADAAIMFANWGGTGVGDCNNDGIVDAADAGELFAAWTGDSGVVKAANGDPYGVPEPTGVGFGHGILSIAFFYIGMRRRADGWLGRP